MNAGPPGAGDSPPAARLRNPWWIPRFLGRAPDIGPGRLRLLGTVALAILFEHYDQAMLTQALKQIADDFGLVESQLGTLLGMVRLGAIPAFFLIPFADRIGRRRLFLVSLIGMSAGTVLCAFTQTANQFIALQVVSRTFMITSSATAFVIVAEEFPAEHRGWGIGILGALGTFGVGLSALLFAVIDVLPYGWRAMYALGLTPLLLFPYFRRRVTETDRFAKHRDELAARGDTPGLLTGWWRPLASLVRAHPWRTVGIGLIGALGSAGHAAAYNFSAYFVQAEHGWAPGQYTALLLVAGTVGIIGHPYAGRFADRRGRRLVGFLLFSSFPPLALAFYRGPGWSLPFVWVPLVFTLTGGNTIARALSTELFPTSFRGTSAGWLQLLETLGAASGLFLVSWGTPSGESVVPMVEWVILGPLAAGLVVLFLPETGRRELEDISVDA